MDDGGMDIAGGGVQCSDWKDVGEMDGASSWTGRMQ